MFPFNTLRLRTVHFLLFGFSVAVVLSEEPGDQDDVIQTARLANEQQCHRLCWYRKLCTSFSYLPVSAPSTENAFPNCVLHASPVNATSDEASEGWMKKPASDSSINNGCKARPCDDTEVCVPSASTSASHVCLPLPSQCGALEAPSDGDVDVIGNSQGDVAHVTCDDEYVASPKGVSVELVCLVTSKWTPFAGTCRKFLHKFLGIHQFPWQLEENSEFCINGIYNTDAEQFTIDLLQQDMAIEVHFSFKKHGFIQAVRENGKWLPETPLGNNPLPVGKNFNVTVRLLSDVLRVVVNKELTYNVALAEVVDNEGEVIDVGQTEAVNVNGEAIDVYFIDLIKGC